MGVTEPPQGYLLLFCLLLSLMCLHASYRAMASSLNLLLLSCALSEEAEACAHTRPRKKRTQPHAGLIDIAHDLIADAEGLLEAKALEIADAEAAFAAPPPHPAPRPAAAAAPPRVTKLVIKPKGLPAGGPAPAPAPTPASHASPAPVVVIKPKLTLNVKRPQQPQQPQQAQHAAQQVQGQAASAPLPLVDSSEQPTGRVLTAKDPLYSGRLVRVWWEEYRLWYPAQVVFADNITGRAR